jgi:hypothetical protein
MDEVTQQNAALVEEAAAAAESLEEQAASLAQAVAVFALNKIDTAPAVERSVGQVPQKARVKPVAMLPHKEPVRLKTGGKVNVPQGLKRDDGDWAEF